MIQLVAPAWTSITSADSTAMQPVSTINSATNQRLFQLEALYAAAPVALCLINHAARYLAVNEAMAGIAGRSVQEMIGMRVAEVFPQAAAD